MCVCAVRAESPWGARTEESQSCVLLEQTEIRMRGNKGGGGGEGGGGGGGKYI